MTHRTSLGLRKALRIAALALAIGLGGTASVALAQTNTAAPAAAAPAAAAPAPAAATPAAPTAAETAAFDAKVKAAQDRIAKAADWAPWRSDPARP